MRCPTVTMIKMLPTLFTLSLALLTGVCPLRPEEVYVKAGEMVVLNCPHYIGKNHNDTRLIWTRYTTQGKYVFDQMPLSEQRQMLINGRSLAILITSVNHEGNYSCSLRNKSNQFWFKLTVYTTQSTEIEDSIKYSTTCYTQESCTLNCPEVNTLAVNTPNITSKDIVWHKKGESSPKDGYFPSVGEKDHGVYTCTRSYLYQGQMYNMTFIMVLDVKPKEKSRQPVILSPHTNQVFYVDLGSTVVIDCEAIVDLNFDEVFWLSDTSFVEMDDSYPVFYNTTQGSNTGEIKITSSLVFRKVSEDDLLKRYTCKLESVSVQSSFVTITLAQKAHLYSSSLALSIVAILLAILVLVFYVKLRTCITLFLRDALGCHRSTSDGKSYDAFLMCYESDTDAGLSDDSRRWLGSVLEEKYGYSLCLHNCNVLPGKAEAAAVSDSIKQSRTLVLVPTFPGCGPGLDVLKDILAGLVEWQTRLVFIKPETTEAQSSLAEFLQLCGDAGDCVTWKGTSSMTPSSTFFKQLRYYLAAPQHPPKIRLLP